MKLQNFVLAAFLSLLAPAAISAPADSTTKTVVAASKKTEGETKKVCIETTDAKTKKPKEVCKTIKVHKKLEGTKVPAK